ncbi:replication factor A protein 2 [Puccinia graminis f. sp. tritici]|uniref:Replication factor A protein 2 n=1 Tax=Puccinia graminis f. sp. tritici TaxID=56615 RepID=A0A5B0R7I9_PUCGR|nr:replication factor A protein 2 [Puccinia graminis f. sp. tritici]
MSTYASRYTEGDDYGGGGGGFMQGSQNNNTPGGTRRVEQALRPVTIKQVLDAEASNTDSAISIQDIDVTNVSFCGVVRDIVRNATNVLLQVEDGTGGIEVRKWIDSSDGESEGFEAETGIQIRDWVRVIGSPKLFNNKKNVAGLRIEKITDFNEINYRLLDAVRVTLAYERGATGAGDKMNIDQSTNHTTHGKIVQAKNPNRTPKQNKIMEYFASIQPPDEGINIHEIARQCNLDVKEVIDETAQLIHEGELFTTVDDEHLMTTTS